jgi:thioredoxin-related protein
VDECNNSDSFKNVAIVELDVDEESSKELLKKYDVKGFPHVVLVHNARDERMVFDRERSKEQLMKFMKEKTM